MGPIEALEAGMKYWALLLCVLLASFRISGIEASAQEYAGPLLPHVGGQITAAFANTDTDPMRKPISPLRP
jgi:hypothetical protein